MLGFDFHIIFINMKGFPMNELLATLGNLVASLGSAQSLGALKEHVALLNTKLQMLKEHVEKLEEENARLVKRNGELREQVARQQASTEFVESKGALFKRLAGGAYSETPYCPVCQRSMWCFQNAFPYECPDAFCGHKADFRKVELKSVIAALPG